MTDFSTDGSKAAQDAQARRLAAPWEAPRGWRYGSAVNNSHVGLWYTAVAFVFFLFAGVLALLMRVQLAVPENDFLSADTYNQVFTLHGSVMMFLFGVPMFEAFAILILPQMLGARDLPFPRLSAYGFWCFVIGGVFVCGSIFFDAAPKGGWFMYPPLTTQYQQGVGADIWLLGLSFIEIASLAAAVELIVGVLKTRPPGMRINLMPLYAWYILVVGAMILFAFPPLIAGDVLFELERALGWPFFNPDKGGDPLLWQHLFWIFGHPEVYIIFLPAIALIAMMLPTFARRPVVGYSWIVLAAVGTGFISFGLWVHHMYTTGIPAISLAFFSAASEAVAIPTGVQIFCFLATALAGRFVRSVITLFIIGALAIFILGGLTGVMVAIAPFDFQAHDSYFVVAHLHYVLIGGMLFPVVAGLFYFFPIVSGKLLSERSGRLAFWPMFIGFNVAFLPMHFTGLSGMPRRVFTYGADTGFGTLNFVSTLGAFLFAAGIAVLVYEVLRPGKQRSPRNPWQAGTLEWLAEMPGRTWGVRSIPRVTSRYPLWDQPALMADVDAGRYYLPDAEEGKRETLITTTIDAKPIQCLRVPGPSFQCMIAAAFTGGAFIFATYKWYTAAGVSALLALFTILCWLWTGTGKIPEKPRKHVGLGTELPLYASGPASVGWWATFITMIGDMSAFLSLVFGYFFFWTVHEEFPPANSPGPGLFWPLLAAGFLLGAWLLTLAAARCNKRDRSAGFYGTLLAAVILNISGMYSLFAGPWHNALIASEHAYPATVWVLVIWTLLHLGIGLIMQLYCIARRAAGAMTGQWDTDIRNVSLYWHFMALTVVITVSVIALFPLVQT
ncbi:cytochrome c oxidase subunit I [Gilvimarinus sp. F26214L]|uniref:cytochrome c oxidase subunit I n=1 Tax=Gilvimarinus sp. DZF01 TaxID=3461371 RepID=UPI004046299C